MKKSYARALPRDWQPFAAVFTALGDGHRQRILLLFERDERLTITELLAVAPLSRTALTHHVRVLEQAGVLKREKQGREVRYSIDRAILERTLTSVLDYLHEHH